MADSDKDILITPNKGQTGEPVIQFTGADNTPLTLRVLDDGTVSFEGSAGQLFSVADGLTGTIYSVNDVSGIPAIEVIDDGTVILAGYGGNVGVGDTDPGAKLSVVGDIQYTGSITDISDARLKQEITPLISSLEKVTQLNGYSYVMSSNGSSTSLEVEMGVLAQEVKYVFPSAVKIIDDSNPEDPYLGVAYIQLIAPMIEAIKELKSRVEALESQIAAP